MKHALITGGAGFIGSYLARFLLDDGYKVTVVDNLSNGSEENIPKGCNFINIDIATEHWVDSLDPSIDYVFHLAAQSSGEISFEDPENDLKINTLAVTLANSGAALAESSSSGTSVGSSSITNPESETVSYALSGTGSSNFAVDSSGNVTTNATLDFETAKSYDLTLTATAGGNTTTDAFTVNVGNVEELESAVLRYSADYNSASRSGFSATATRGPSGSSLAAYTLEQVGTTNSTDITSVDDTMPIKLCISPGESPAQS